MESNQGNQGQGARKVVVSLQISHRFVGFLKGPGGVQGEGVFLTVGNPLGIPREDWGTLGKIRGITTTPKQNPIIDGYPSKKMIWFVSWR